MDVICTDRNLIETGTLHNFSINFDSTETMDFEITVDVSNNELQGKSMWYINDTAYGGIVDYIDIDSETNEKKYRGRNLRGMLQSKFIIPKVGTDYRIESGNVSDIINSLLDECGLSSKFVFAPSDYTVSNFKFDRYTSLYDGIVKILYATGNVMKITVVNGLVQLSMSNRLDYSDEMEYTNSDIKFKLSKGYNPVNHLICLGKGELKDRQVIHLYVDGDGDIVDQQYFYGIDEVVEVYDYSNVESVAELKKAGIDKLGELKSTDSFEVTSVVDDRLKIGDVIGAYDTYTKTGIRREIVNIIVDITDTTIQLEYRVGGDEPAAAGIPSDLVEEYELPTASHEILGGVKVGDTLEINNGRVDCPAIVELNLLKEQLTRLSE